MTLIDCHEVTDHSNGPDQAAAERTLTHLDIVVALTFPSLTQPLPPSTKPDILEDFDAELRRWLLSQD